MNETNAAFAIRTIQSLKNILYRYMEGYEYKYIHKYSQLVTTLKSGKNCSIDLSPKNVKTSHLLSFLYSKPLREYKKPKNKTAGRIRISKYDLPFTKCYKPPFTQNVFELIEIPSKIPPKRMNRTG